MVKGLDVALELGLDHLGLELGLKLGLELDLDHFGLELEMIEG